MRSTVPFLLLQPPPPPPKSGPTARTAPCVRLPCMVVYVFCVYASVLLFCDVFFSPYPGDGWAVGTQLSLRSDIIERYSGCSAFGVLGGIYSNNTQTTASNARNKSKVSSARDRFTDFRAAYALIVCGLHCSALASARIIVGRGIGAVVIRELFSVTQLVEQ